MTPRAGSSYGKGRYDVLVFVPNEDADGKETVEWLRIRRIQPERLNL